MCGGSLGTFGATVSGRRREERRGATALHGERKKGVGLTERWGDREEGGEGEKRAERGGNRGRDEVT